MQVIGLHIGTSFAEASVWEGSKKSLAADRFYMPRTNLRTALPRFFQQHPELAPQTAFISSRFLERLFDFRLGGSTAQFVTAGFERWSFLNSAPAQASWLVPRKSQPISSPDLSFSIDERVEASGEVSRPLDPASLQPMIEKLKLMEIKRVTVLFLHARKNPANEEIAVKALTDAGFEVFRPDPQFRGSEGASWRACLLEASFRGTFEELRQDVELGLASLPQPPTVFFADGEGRFQSAADLRRVSTLFATDRFLDLESAAHKAEAILDLGLESWRILTTGQQRTTWESPWGPVAQNRTARSELKIQPTQALEIGPRGWPVPQGSSRGFEPGPLCFGRGQKSMVFDLFTNEAAATDLAAWMPEAARGRIESHLMALGRSCSAKDAGSLRTHLREDLIHHMALELRLRSPARRWLVSGVFAPWLLPLLRKELPDREWILSENSDADRVAKAGASR